jgi:hypothetical protein
MEPVMQLEYAEKPLEATAAADSSTNVAHSSQVRTLGIYSPNQYSHFRQIIHASICDLIAPTITINADVVIGNLACGSWTQLLASVFVLVNYGKEKYRHAE